MTLRVLVRVDASPAIGLGHAMRCLALVQVLRASGHDVVIATLAMPETLRHQYHSLGVATQDMASVMAGSAEDAASTEQIAYAHDVHWVVADGYAFRLPWQQQVRRGIAVIGARLALLDDEAKADAWDVDLLLNQNLGFAREAYTDRAGAATVLAGAQYVLLREEFRAMPRAPRASVPVARRLLITMGGADPDNVTTQVVQALSALDDLELRVVIGAANTHGRSIEAAVRDLPNTVTARVLAQVTDMPQQMQWADLAISAGGSTLWELAYMQLPALVVVLAENQRGGASACVAAGSIHELGDVDALHSSEIARAVTALRMDQSQRDTMAQAGATLVDGLGARRVMHALEAASQVAATQ
ncbi:MAG: UDP-2,4-diacetamido-2,4,6-trideoxy-beta-L-altropyranose hydrolase [Gemmatimonadaceae bacterium]|nr:UDP-2,4-diacetamido-2,4,6-trideoxy-beta-L-altropyranose hydrolase [Gemmatimonadaceae bacterium]